MARSAKNGRCPTIIFDLTIGNSHNLKKNTHKNPAGRVSGLAGFRGTGYQNMFVPARLPPTLPNPSHPLPYRAESGWIGLWLSWPDPINKYMEICKTAYKNLSTIGLKKVANGAIRFK